MAVETLSSGSATVLTEHGIRNPVELRITDGGIGYITPSERSAPTSGERLLPGEGRRIITREKRVLHAVDADVSFERQINPVPDDPVFGDIDVDVEGGGETVILPSSGGNIGGDKVEDSTTGTGSGNAATITLGDSRDDVNIYVNTSGNATLTVEAFIDSAWREIDSQTYSGSSEAWESYDNVVYGRARAYLNQNITRVVITGKGAP